MQGVWGGVGWLAPAAGQKALGQKAIIGAPLTKSPPLHLKFPLAKKKDLESEEQQKEEKQDMSEVIT